MQFEIETESGAAQLGLALAVAHDRQVGFLEDVLELAVVTPRVLTPTRDPASFASEVLTGLWKAGRSDMRTISKETKRC